MKKKTYKNLAELDEELRRPVAPPIYRPEPPEIPENELGHPMIVPPEVWQNTVVSFQHLEYQKKRSYKRLECYGAVAFYNKKGKIVAVGEMREISRKGARFEVVHIAFELDDIRYLEFLDHSDLVLNHVKVDLRYGQIKDSRIYLGVEFIKPTLAFQEKLVTFIAAKRREMGVFEEFEDI